MGKPVVYCYERCGTCRKALSWLMDRSIDAKLVAIRETPPSLEELTLAYSHFGAVGPLLNTSGSDYRELGGKAYFATLQPNQVLELLSRRGNLIKRPFVVADRRILVGFSPEAWSDFFR
jgi:arsenate reductase